MTLTLNELTKNLEYVDQSEIISSWQWLIPDVKKIIILSCLGDLFVIGKDDAIYWIATDTGTVTKVATDSEHFTKLLTDENNIDNWFLPQLIDDLINSGKILMENEVYSYKNLPVLGGGYSVDNIDPTDMSVNFAFTGQIFEQIKNLPDGTKVNITLVK